MKKKLMSDRERLLLKISINDSGCWLWNGWKDKDGYGYIRTGSRTDGSRDRWRVHRFMYEADVGPIPAGKVIDHLCRNRHCVNPAHMEPVTTEINTKRGMRANATHCKSGHPLSGTNLHIDQSSGKRACKTCRRRWSREFQRRTNYRAQKAYKERVKSASATN